MTESQVSWITCLSCRQTNIQNLKRSKCPRKKSPTSKRHQLLSWLLASFLHKELLSLPLLLPIRQHAPFPQLHSSLSFRHKRRHKTSQAHIWLSLFSLLSVYCQIIQLANTMYQSYTKGQLITGRFCWFVTKTCCDNRKLDYTTHCACPWPAHWIFVVSHPRL